MKPQPCKDCQRRQLGCHAECTDYKAYKDWMAEQKKRIRKEKDISNDFNAYREFAHHRLKHWDKKGK